jgi:hypothetical protein
MSSLAPVFSFSGSVCGIVAQQARVRQSAFAHLYGAQTGLHAESSALICWKERKFLWRVSKQTEFRSEERADTATCFTFSVQFVVRCATLVERRSFGCHRWHAPDGFTQCMAKPPENREVWRITLHNVRYDQSAKLWLI